MIVVGTAGHIDHGKSSIVKRLTGTDPDRLPEEKTRGMTIDLGFAFYKTSQNETIAFVDVPGHERFVKNMIAGAGGIDAVLLVVAADDGWMPQTEEHFQIVRLLGVRHGLIVLNKIDLVDKNTLKVTQATVRQNIRGSFLENAPIIEVSSTNGDGFEELRKVLNDLSQKITAKRDIGKARLYLDRVFIQKGIGAVATGTLKDGSLKVGDNVNIWPTLKQAKIKTIQSNNEMVTQAFPSQRTAITLTGIDKSGIVRGGAVTRIESLDYFIKNPILALKVELLKDAAIAIENRRKVLLLVGTSETEGEIRLFTDVPIARGQSGLVFFKPNSPVFTLVGDKVILRLPSPMLTIGGGVVLDHLDSIPNKKNLDKLSYLTDRDVDFIKQLIISELHKSVAVKETELLKYASASNEIIADSLNELVRESRVNRLGSFVYDKNVLAAAAKETMFIINKLCTGQKGIRGVTIPEIAHAVKLNHSLAELLTGVLQKEGRLETDNEYFFPTKSKTKLEPEIQKAHDFILRELQKNPFTPPDLKTLVAPGKIYKEAIRIMINAGEIHKCGAEFVFLESSWNQINSFIRKTLNEKNQMTVGEIRDKFNITRKYAIPILEETDRLKITKRNGDVRVRGANFAKETADI